MDKPLLHVFRNTPMGRETLLLSVYLCRQLKLPLDIYLPKEKRFLFYFDSAAVQVDLDASYLSYPESARQRAEELMQGLGQCRFIEAKSYTATELPDLPTGFSLMTCPRSMSDQTSRIGLGHIGPKVRRILLDAPFPIIIPSVVYKPWNSITVLYGGSPTAAEAVKLALRFQQRCQRPLQIVSIGERTELEQMLREQGLLEQVRGCDWQVHPGDSLAEHLYGIPHDALVVLGAYAHGPIRSLFGSTMELVQSQLPQSLVVVGPNYSA
jgi:nucleotide-binding universal stress UspA family protein